MREVNILTLRLPRRWIAKIISTRLSIPTWTAGSKLAGQTAFESQTFSKHCTKLSTTLFERLARTTGISPGCNLKSTRATQRRLPQRLLFLVSTVYLPVFARPATRPKMSVRRIFEEDQKTEIERLTNAKLEGQERAHRDGKDLKARAEAVTELWTNCDNKEEYEKRAAEENAVREAELTPEQLSLNQSEFGRELSTVVASYFGKHGKQIGDAIFCLRVTRSWTPRLTKLDSRSEWQFLRVNTMLMGTRITVNGFSDEKFGGTTEEFEAWKTYAMHTLQPGRFHFRL
ncbi:hypothetical protein MIND_01288000 [Mycena indigotica]|uniref:Uncharacterized protein n=1 Tax=Mycena indigotica TaxID=2126181 RepID=A0A8H6VX53_9AGAR|nr:uncharacterized protein MIND_01288000 [Mycena indigotica]KAF7291429.1 hypothetical protein MIND_01288000 [Mycena indigotica]